MFGSNDLCGIFPVLVAGREAPMMRLMVAAVWYEAVGRGLEAVDAVHQEAGSNSSVLRHGIRDLVVAQRYIIVSTVSKTGVDQAVRLIFLDSIEQCAALMFL